MDDTVLVKEIHPPEDLDHEHLVVFPGQDLLVAGFGGEQARGMSAQNTILLYNEAPRFLFQTHSHHGAQLSRSCGGEINNPGAAFAFCNVLPKIPERSLSTLYNVVLWSQPVCLPREHHKNKVFVCGWNWVLVVC